MTDSSLTTSDIVRHPLSLATGAFGIATTLLNVPAVDIIATYLWMNVGELFTVLSLAGFTVAPNTGLPEEPLTVAAVVAGIAFATKKIWEMATELRTKLNNES